MHYLTLDEIRGAIEEIGYQPRQRDVFYQLLDPAVEQAAVDAGRRRYDELRQSARLTTIAAVAKSAGNTDCSP